MDQRIEDEDAEDHERGQQQQVAEPALLPLRRWLDERPRSSRTASTRHRASIRLPDSGSNTCSASGARDRACTDFVGLRDVGLRRAGARSPAGRRRAGRPRGARGRATRRPTTVAATPPLVARAAGPRGARRARRRRAPAASTACASCGVSGARPPGSSTTRSSPTRATRPSTVFIGGLPMKRATNRFAGRSYTSCGGPTCWSTPSFEHRDAVAHRHRLDLVVGDVDDRGRRAVAGARRARRASAPAASRRGSRAARP